MTATDSLRCCCGGGGGAGDAGITVLARHIKMCMVGWRRAWVVDLRYRLRVFTAECLPSIILSPAMMVFLYDTRVFAFTVFELISVQISVEISVKYRLKFQTENGVILCLRFSFSFSFSFSSVVHEKYFGGISSTKLS